MRKNAALLLIAGGIAGGVSGVGMIVLFVLSVLRQQEQLHPILRQHIKNSMPAFVFSRCLDLGSLDGLFGKVWIYDPRSPVELPL